jgi:hypothetical protein
MEMPDYRLYFLDQAGHIGGVVEMACLDDEEAAELARAHNDGRAMELWHRDRHVRAFARDEDRDRPDGPDCEPGIDA